MMFIPPEGAMQFVKETPNTYLNPQPFYWVVPSNRQETCKNPKSCRAFHHVISSLTLENQNICRQREALEGRRMGVCLCHGRIIE